MPGTSTVDPTVTPATRHQVQVGDGPTPEIGELQQRLTAVGNRVSVTGIFDAATASAVTAFQTAHPPWTATGVADLPTWARLDGSSTTAPSWWSRPRHQRVQGSSHPEVARRAVA